jgi:hypothetical protein
VAEQLGASFLAEVTDLDATRDVTVAKASPPIGYRCMGLINASIWISQI